jgi:hypothetical protein
VCCGRYCVAGNEHASALIDVDWSVRLYSAHGFPHPAPHAAARRRVVARCYRLVACRCLADHSWWGDGCQCGGSCGPCVGGGQRLCLATAGRLKQSIPLVWCAHSAQREGPGLDHCDTLSSRNNLALVYQTPAGRPRR